MISYNSIQIYTIFKSPPSVSLETARAGTEKTESKALLLVDSGL